MEGSCYSSAWKLTIYISLYTLSWPFRRTLLRRGNILLMPMKHTCVLMENQVWASKLCPSSRVLTVSTYWRCFLNTLPTFMFHNVPCGWELYQTSSLPSFLGASALGNAPATCCCLASQLRFCSSKALELPRRNYWGEEPSEESCGFLFSSHHSSPKKWWIFRRHLNHFHPENIGMYLSICLFLWGCLPEWT